MLVQSGDRALQQVRIQLSDLRSKEGQVFASSQISAVPVGYVETKSIPPYGSSHVGWWPDPILDFLSAVDIAPGDVQAFWVRVRAPRDQPPGLYTGTLEVFADQLSVATLDLSVEVYPFAVPACSPLPLAVTFAPHDLPTPRSEQQQATWRESSEYPVKAWREATAVGRFYCGLLPDVRQPLLLPGLVSRL